MNLKKLIDQIATGDAAGVGSNAEHFMRDHVIYNGSTGEFYNNFQTDDYPEGYQRCTTMYSSNYTTLMHEGVGTAARLSSSPASSSSSSYQKEDSSYVNNCYNDSIHHQHLLQQPTHHHLLRQPSHHLVNYSNGSLPVLMQPQHSHSQIVPSNLCQYNGSSSHANAKAANDDDGHHHHNLNNHRHHQHSHHHSHLHNDDNRSRKSVINGDNDENDQMDETKLGVDHHYSRNDDDNIVGDNDNSNGGQLFVIKKETLNLL